MASSYLLQSNQLVGLISTDGCRCTRAHQVKFYPNFDRSQAKSEEVSNTLLHVRNKKSVSGNEGSQGL